jgi:hypothetical protein
MAMTMLTAVVMVLFDRTILKRPAQIIVGILIVAISFTHYTTSYLVAAILLCGWCASLIWSRGWLGTPRAMMEKHRYDVNSRKIINIVLVVIAFAAAIGWNNLITRNDALGAPAAAVTTKGAGLSTSTNTQNLPPRQFERLLVSEFKKTDSWIVPVPGSGSVPLRTARDPSTRGVVRTLKGKWQELSYLVVESIWLMLGISLLYGIFRLGRRRSYEYSADLVGLAVAGLLIGGVLRFSATLAAFYDPERAAIFTAILLAAPLTLFLDDAVSSLLELKNALARWVSRLLAGAGVIWIVVLVVAATGLGALFFGGQAPGSLSSNDWNAQELTVSTPEFATAIWLRNNLSGSDVVQSDFLGQTVLLSEPGSYHLVPEILPPVVNNGSYVYLSGADLADDRTQAQADDGAFQSAFKSTLGFFNQHFYVVYSTGITRVYH